MLAAKSRHVSVVNWAGVAGIFRRYYCMSTGKCRRISAVNWAGAVGIFRQRVWRELQVCFGGEFGGGWRYISVVRCVGAASKLRRCILRCSVHGTGMVASMVGVSEADRKAVRTLEDTGGRHACILKPRFSHRKKSRNENKIQVLPVPNRGFRSTTA